MQSQHIIIKPIISEQSLKDAQMGKYSFLVNKKANKTEIKKAIEEVFEVKVIKIMTNITKGSITRNTKVGRKITVFSDKKARVVLQKGQSIAIFDEHLGLDDEKDKSKKEKAKSKEKKEAVSKTKTEKKGEPKE
jgi:large subunit ribosomal protein L23